MSISPTKHRLKRRVMCLVKVILVLAMLGVLGIAALLGTMWLDHTRETVLPTPTGSFAVGRTTYVWSDARQTDPMAPQPDTKRELFAWIWYPAVPQKPSQTTADYLPTPWRKAIEGQRGVLINKFLTRDLSRVRTHSIDGAEVSPQERSYPVVLMQAGSDTLAEDLASHGYIVVGLDAPYRSGIVVFPDGRVIEAAPQNKLADDGPAQLQLANSLVEAGSADMGFALDQLEQLNTSDPSGKFLGRLDMKRLGVFGWSIGGATALKFCHDDSRCKAGIDVDGFPIGKVVDEGVAQPIMFLMEDMNGEPDPDSQHVMANIHTIYNRLPNDHRWLIGIRGANHFMFSDDGAMLKSPMLVSVMRTFGIVKIDGRRQIAVTDHYISTFFDVYLKGAPAAELKSEPAYPEAEYLN
jgi:predicted dienelactone hydrolase